MRRIGILGTPAARPLDFVDAFLGADIPATRSEAEEDGPRRTFVVEAERDGVPLRLTVAIAPRRFAREAFEAVLAGSDAAIVLVGAGGWREQEAAVAALAEARRATGDATPLVHVVNSFVPPRLQDDPPEEEWAARLEATTLLRGRFCWWRHEKTGTDLARAAVDAALRLAQ